MGQIKELVGEIQQTGKLDLAAVEQLKAIVDAEDDIDVSDREALIGLFRIGQEFLNIALGQPSVSTIHITVAVDADALRIVVSHDGRAALSQNDEFAIRSTAHRAQTFDGQLSLRKFDEEGAVYCAQLPLARLTQ